MTARSRYCVICRRMRVVAGHVWAPHPITGTATPCPMSERDPRSASPTARRTFSLLKPGRNPKPKRRPLPVAISSR